MKKTLTALLILTSTSAYANGLTDKSLSVVKLIDTQTVEFHSSIDMVIVATMALVSAVHLFFG